LCNNIYIIRILCGSDIGAISCWRIDCGVLRVDLSFAHHFITSRFITSGLKHYSMQAL
uniref:Ovule protein n=1 Tax=Ascaris lumbricoides TaxID=6252 RepID=A0A0M3IWF4_ASCLU